MIYLHMMAALFGSAFDKPHQARYFNFVADFIAGLLLSLIPWSPVHARVQFVLVIAFLP